VLIGPIVFLTIIGGIAGVADLKKVGLTESVSGLI
jgi:aerobic C4-dicarboxylate transport protein